MTPLSYPRRLASQLLRAALSIAPHDTLDWGQGMLSELNHVEGNWSALLWAFGGAGVLAKYAVLSAIFTGSNRPILPSGGDLFEKETPMRKTVLSAIGACVAASLLFFLAPSSARPSTSPSLSSITYSKLNAASATAIPIRNWKH